jgi:hypothetical protein
LSRGDSAAQVRSATSRIWPFGPEKQYQISLQSVVFRAGQHLVLKSSRDNHS